MARVLVVDDENLSLIHIWMPRMPVFFYGFGPGRRRDGPAGTEAREGWQCPLRGGVFWPGCPGAGIRPESRGTIGTVRRSVLVEKDSACR